MNKEGIVKFIRAQIRARFAGFGFFANSLRPKDYVSLRKTEPALRSSNLCREANFAIPSKEKIHFIGMGGIGMSAIARILIEKGYEVQGSDLQPSSLLNELKQLGAFVQIGHGSSSMQNVSKVVFSSAVHPDHIELRQARDLQIPLFHRSDLLHQLMDQKKAILVTGTHGKTTTTALLTSVLVEANLDPSFVIGGIHQKFKVNGKNGSGEYFVAEADESDGSFLKTPYFGAIVTNLENEHLDYWKSPEKLNSAFQQFLSQKGILFWCGDDERLKAFTPNGISYGFDSSNDLRILECEFTDFGISFSISWNKIYRNIELPLLGKHNALNATAVFGLCIKLGISEEIIRRAFRSFSGVKRRLEWIGQFQTVQVFDDYAHHPTEIRETLKALRKKIREKRLVVVFQPHRYTRVRNLLEEYLHCFADADLVFMTDIYEAGESPFEDLNTTIFYEKLKQKLKNKLHYRPRAQLEKLVAKELLPHDVVITMGAGDITKSGIPILKFYQDLPKKLKVALLFGGVSPEHPVSIQSAKKIFESLDSSLYQTKLFGVTKEGVWITGPDAFEQIGSAFSSSKISIEIFQELNSCDVAIPVFHGPKGEDGMVQGFLDTLDIPYVGCDYRAGSICMQKSWAKQIAQMNGIATSKFIEISKSEFQKDPIAIVKKMEENLRFPIWMKAVHLGSSIGVYRVEKKEEVVEQAKLIFELDDTLIAEEEIVGREIEFSIFGNEFIQIAPSGEIIKKDQFHAYHNKYGPTASPIETPASILPIQEMIGKELARTLYEKMGCKGLARIDFFLDQEGHFWFNEINPFPGCTATSGYPLMWEKGGYPLKKLCDEWIILAMARKRRNIEIQK